MLTKYNPSLRVTGLLTKILLPFFVFAFCLASATANGEAQSQTHATPQRIVVFPLFAEEMLLEMIGPERIVYVGHKNFENGEGYSPMMELAKDIEGRYWNMTIDETILALNPDLIVLEEDFLRDYAEIWPDLYQANIPFVFLDSPKTIDDVRDVLIDLGEIVGTPEKAAQMSEDMEADLAHITENVSTVPEEKRKHVFHYVYHTNDYASAEEEASTAFYRQSLFTMVANAAGIIAEGPDTDDWADGEPEEWLVRTNPDIITFDYGQYDTDGSLYDISGQYHDAFINDLLTNPKLSNVTAIKNRAIYPLRLFQSQLIVHSVEELAWLAYPDLFLENRLVP